MPKVAQLIFNDNNYQNPVFYVDIRDIPLADLLSVVKPSHVWSRNQFVALGDLIKTMTIASQTVTRWYASSSYQWDESKTQQTYRELEGILDKFGVEYYYIVYFTDDPPGWGVPSESIKNELLTRIPRVIK
jgi:hypothetical protein